MAANGLVSVWGNQYSVPPGVIGTEVSVRWRLGDPSFDVISASGRLVATHRKVPRGQGRVVRLPEHTAALQKVVLGRSPPLGPPNPNPTGHHRQRLGRSPPTLGAEWNTTSR